MADESHTILKPGIENAITHISSIICEAITCCGMSKEEVDELKEAFRDLVTCTRGNR